MVVSVAQSSCKSQSLIFICILPTLIIYIAFDDFIDRRWAPSSNSKVARHRPRWVHLTQRSAHSHTQTSRWHAHRPNLWTLSIPATNYACMFGYASARASVRRIGLCCRQNYQNPHMHLHLQCLAMPACIIRREHHCRRSSAATRQWRPRTHYLWHTISTPNLYVRGVHVSVRKVSLYSGIKRCAEAH